MTQHEIGSEFPLREKPEGNVGRIVRGLIGNRPSQLVGSGREGLRLLLHDAAARGRTRVAFPAYLCPAMLEALHPDQTATFLPTTAELAPTSAGISAFVRSGYPDDAVLVAPPYFGARWSTEISDSVQGAWAAGIEILEDRSHSLFSEPAYLDTRRGFASLRKWAAMPDGGIAFGTALDGLAPTEEPGGPSTDARRDGMEAKARWLDSGEGDKAAFLESIERGETALSAVSGVRPISPDSKAALGGWSTGEMRDRRKSNARRLHRGLRDLHGIEPLLRFGPDETPLGVPVLCAERDRVREALTAQEIYCPVHWELPEAVSAEQFGHEHAVQGRILTLVCDQRYGDEEMNRTVEALRRLA
jgi:hypothetical protein